MIQRVQSIYLFVAALLMSLVMILPLGRFFVGAGQFELLAFGVRNMEGEYIAKTVYMGVVALLCALVPAVNIFLFRRRMLQLRLCVVEIVLLLGMQVFVAWYLFQAHRAVAGTGASGVGYSVCDVLPLVSVILVWLAMRGITRDEIMVRSLDRIR